MASIPALQNILWLTDSDGTPIDFGAPLGPAVTVPQLLPSSCGTWEQAIAAGMSDFLPVPYAEIMDPYRTPIAFLPFLAAHYSVDLWFDNWSEARRREAIAQAAGRSTLYDGEIAALKTTRGGAIRYLALVDGIIVDAVSYPAYAFSDDAFCDFDVLDHPPHLATYLVKVETFEPHAAFVGSCFADEDFSGETDTGPHDRCLQALRVAKAPHTEIRVDFQNFRVITAGDGITAGGGTTAGQYIARTKL